MVEIIFHVPYHTNNRERIIVRYTCIPSGEVQTAVMSSNDGYNWAASVKLGEECTSIEYEYYLESYEGKCLRTEAGLKRRYYIDRTRKVRLFDSWMDCPYATVYNRSGLSYCIGNHADGVETCRELLMEKDMLLLKALPPQKGWRWAVVGNNKSWGEWDPKKARPMQHTDTYEWGIKLSKEDINPDFRYKYIWIREDGMNEFVWEEGEDRALYAAFTAENDNGIMMQTDTFPQIPNHQQLWRGAGIVIPVFSLRSAGSFGVGDFGDLKMFVKWVSSLGMNAVQLLPINDTTTTGGHRDSYPYSAISVFALHPIYIDPREWSNSKAYEKYHLRGAQLNESKHLDYDGVYQTKINFLRDLYIELRNSITRKKSYKIFCCDNEHWLLPYTDFCAHRDMYQTANFRHWPKCEMDKNKLAKMETDRAFYTFVQYLLHMQLTEVAQTARSLGIIIKGDIPIGICRDSVPAWHDTHLFHFNGQAGAPPDAFATCGQNWGFPTYNWDEMAKDNYQWWRKRLEHTEQYFDAYRIDHVLGFFRIWEIPYDQLYGTLGYFRPSLPYTLNELSEYGFPDAAHYAQPILVPTMMQEFLQACSAAEVERFVTQGPHGITLAKPYLSQRYISENLPAGKLCDTLMNAASEVLFIEDVDHPGCYHPRITAQNTHLYKNLPEHLRKSFDRLYDHFFYVRHNDFWAEQAMKKIPSVINYASSNSEHETSAKGMLPCAEDLGMIPSSVKGVLDKLHILSLEIQRMPKQYGVRFANPSDYPYMSVATPGTHDMSPFRLWWQESSEQTNAYWKDILGRNGEAPTEAPAEVCEQMVLQHFKSPSMLCLIALQDLLGIDAQLRNPDVHIEQINNPSDPNHYWCYRMHLNIETLISSTPFNEKIRGMLKLSGRGEF